MPFNPFGWVANVLAVTHARLDLLDAGIVEAQRAPFVTALPTTGPGGGALVDGQECYFRPDPNNTAGNNGVAWHLKYNAALAKWLCIGGPPWLSVFNVASHVDMATNANYAAFASTPSFTAPFPGLYRVRFGHSCFHTAGAGASIFMAPSANGVAPTDNTDAIVSGYGDANQEQHGDSRSVPITVTTAGHVIDLRARTTVSTAKIRFPWMEILPVRVG